MDGSVKQEPLGGSRLVVIPDTLQVPRVAVRHGAHGQRGRSFKQRAPSWTTLQSCHQANHSLILVVGVVGAGRWEIFPGYRGAWRCTAVPPPPPPMGGAHHR